MNSERCPGVDAVGNVRRIWLRATSGFLTFGRHLCGVQATPGLELRGVATAAHAPSVAPRQSRMLATGERASRARAGRLTDPALAADPLKAKGDRFR